MRDIDRVTSTGEPPRRGLESRPGKRWRRIADPDEPPPRTPENAHASAADTKRSRAIDLRV
jgi:hypothetical protein